MYPAGKQDSTLLYAAAASADDLRDYSPYIMDRKHSNTAVNKAGDWVAGSHWQLLKSDQDEWDRQFDIHFNIVTDWRNIHGVPLKVVSDVLAKRAATIDSGAIIAQRLKRFRSIRLKLKNSPVNNLTTMQDIAGCRAVLGNVAQAYALKGLYESLTHSVGPELVQKWTKDYIQHPKPDGYRSIHLVFKFRTSREHMSHCNGLKVEVQIRSQMQHAWAMAVETASAVTNQALKSGVGEIDWKRFFFLVGDIIASTEGTPTICGMDLDSLRSEAAKLARSLKVITLLENMQHVIESFSSFEGNGEDELYLLELDSVEREIRYKGYSKAAFSSAADAYTELERANRENKDIHIVLVSVESLQELKTAYPSFFLDSSGFIQIMRQQIYGQQ